MNNSEPLKTADYEFLALLYRRVTERPAGGCRHEGARVREDGAMVVVHCGCGLVGIMSRPAAERLGYLGG